MTTVAAQGLKRKTMKILHIVNQNPAQYILDLINEQRKTNEVEMIYLDAEPDYDVIVDHVINSDRVISWSNVHET